MQTKKLRHNEKQKERSRQAGNEQVLQILQKTYPASRNQISFYRKEDAIMAESAKKKKSIFSRIGNWFREVRILSLIHIFGAGPLAESKLEYGRGKQFYHNTDSAGQRFHWRNGESYQNSRGFKGQYPQPFIARGRFRNIRCLHQYGSKKPGPSSVYSIQDPQGSGCSGYPPGESIGVMIHESNLYGCKTGEADC